MAGICVFCSSSKYVDKSYFTITDNLAEIMVKFDFNLIWGGANIGLMGHIAKMIQKYGGKVIGVLPKALSDIGLGYTNADKLIIADDMSSRKMMMNDMADAFICLPGGFGTMEEILEVITLKQLGYIDKPIVFFNINNYFDYFLKFVDHMIVEKFIKKSNMQLYNVINNIEDIIKYIKNYQGVTLENKW